MPDVRRRARDLAERARKMRADVQTMEISMPPPDRDDPPQDIEGGVVAR